jgi:hypothetical protein|tara:strand:- start:188 stop:532 length:345 start_codon:yes stop_codon:yes gene_type:complete
MISGIYKAGKLVSKAVKKIVKKTKKKKPSSAQKNYKQQSTLQRGDKIGSKSPTGKMSSIGKYTPTKKPKVKKVKNADGKEVGYYWHYTDKGKKVLKQIGWKGTKNQRKVNPDGR